MIRARDTVPLNAEHAENPIIPSSEVSMWRLGNRMASSYLTHSLPSGTIAEFLGAPERTRLTDHRLHECPVFKDRCS
jgi:hypothetical protein